MKTLPSSENLTLETPQPPSLHPGHIGLSGLTGLTLFEIKHHIPISALNFQLESNLHHEQSISPNCNFAGCAAWGGYSLFPIPPLWISSASAPKLLSSSVDGGSFLVPVWDPGRAKIWCDPSLNSSRSGDSGLALLRSASGTILSADVECFQTCSFVFRLGFGLLCLSSGLPVALVSRCFCSIFLCVFMLSAFISLLVPCCLLASVCCCFVLAAEPSKLNPSLNPLIWRLYELFYVIWESFHCLTFALLPLLKGIIALIITPCYAWKNVVNPENLNPSGLESNCIMLVEETLKLVSFSYQSNNNALNNHKWISGIDPRVKKPALLKPSETKNTFSTIPLNNRSWKSIIICIYDYWKNVQVQILYAEFWDVITPNFVCNQDWRRNSQDKKWSKFPKTPQVDSKDFQRCTQLMKRSFQNRSHKQLNQVLNSLIEGSLCFFTMRITSSDTE